MPVLAFIQRGNSVEKQSICQFMTWYQRLAVKVVFQKIEPDHFQFCCLTDHVVCTSLNPFQEKSFRFCIHTTPQFEPLYYWLNLQKLGILVFQGNPAVTYAAAQHQGRLFWITCKRLKVLRKTGRLQLIQNSAPSVAGRRQCCIRISTLTKLITSILNVTVKTK